MARWLKVAEWNLLSPVLSFPRHSHSAALRLEIVPADRSFISPFALWEEVQFGAVFSVPVVNNFGLGHQESKLLISDTPFNDPLHGMITGEADV